MPVSLTLQPVDLNITKNPSILKNSATYYVVKLGKTKVRSEVTKIEGDKPTWKNSVSIPGTEEKVCKLKLKTKRSLLPDKTVGVCQINLEELNEFKVSRWYDVTHKNKITGRILIEGSLSPAGVSQSSNAIDEKREQLVNPEEYARQVASLHNIPENAGVLNVEQPRAEEVMVRAAGDVLNSAEREREGVEHGSVVSKEEENNQEPSLPKIVINKDSFLEEIPAEKSREEDIQEVAKFTHNM